MVISLIVDLLLTVTSDDDGSSKATISDGWYTFDIDDDGVFNSDDDEKSALEFVSINGDRSSRWLDDECVKLNIELIFYRRSIVRLSTYWIFVDYHLIMFLY